MEVELKPCPFCGGEAKLIDDDWSYVICTKCGIHPYHKVSILEAIEAWNTRTNLWHPGTPTEKGWYILAYRYGSEDADIEYITLEWDDVWKDMKVGWDALKVFDLGWQKFDEFKENKSDRRIISESNV